jgi:hypothetical protein
MVVVDVAYARSSQNPAYKPTASLFSLLLLKPKSLEVGHLGLAKHQVQRDLPPIPLTKDAARSNSLQTNLSRQEYCYEASEKPQTVRRKRSCDL